MFLSFIYHNRNKESNHSNIIATAQVTQNPKYFQPKVQYPNTNLYKTKIYHRTYKTTVILLSIKCNFILQIIAFRYHRLLTMNDYDLWRWC